MTKVIAALIAGAFAFGSAAGYCAETPKKKEDLTKDERVEMRGRADRLIAERAAQPATPAKAAAVEKAPKAKKGVKKPAKGTTGTTGKANPKT